MRHLTSAVVAVANVRRATRSCRSPPLDPTPRRTTVEGVDDLITASLSKRALLAPGKTF